jgi:K+-transporting ATPase KdpF subunit
MNSKPNTIAWTLLVLSVGLMVYLFAASRSDPSLRIAALVAGTGLVSSLSSIASTMLTGKDVTQRNAADLPPNTTTVDTATIKTGDASAPKA